MNTFSGAVLAGGASSRMGSDKALISLDGKRLIEVATSALHEAGAAEVFVVGGDGVQLRELGLRVVADRFPGEGPLGGVITALTAATHDVVAVLACDHVATEGVAVRSVVGALGSADVVVPVVDGRQQVLHAAWRRSVVGPLEQAYHNGARSIRAALDGLAVVQLLDGDPCWFRDADTPSDLPKPTVAGDDESR